VLNIILAIFNTHKHSDHSFANLAFAIAELKSYKKWDAFGHQMGKHLGKVYQEIEDTDL